MTKHLQLLSLQLHNSKLYFTAYNFFEVNWTLLQKVSMVSVRQRFSKKKWFLRLQ